MKRGSASDTLLLKGMELMNGYGTTTWWEGLMIVIQWWRMKKKSESGNGNNKKKSNEKLEWSWLVGVEE